MAESKLLVSILFLCLFFNLSLADTTANKEDDDVTTQSSDSNIVPLTRLTFRTVNHRFPLKPIHHRHVEVIPDGAISSGEKGPLYYHHHHREDTDGEGDDKVDDHRVKRVVFKRSDLDRFDGDEMLDRIRKHHHDFDLKHRHKYNSHGLMNRVRKFWD